HALREYFLERFRSLACAVTRSGATVDLGARIFVVMHDEFRAGALLNPCESGKRHALAAIVPDIKKAEVFRVGPIFIFGFDIDLPLPSEAIEIIDEEAAHERLQRT